MAWLQGTLVRRLWWLLFIIAVILLMAATIVLTDSRSSDVPQIQLPSFPGESQPTAQPVQQTQISPVPVVNPPAQIEPEVVAPTAPTVVDCKGVWTEVRGFDPSTIPVEEGFYSGRSDYNFYPNTTKGDPGPVPVRAAYAWKVLPHLEGLPVAVAAARDNTNRNIVLLAFDADRYGPYILLSVDGGKNSFCKLDLLPSVDRPLLNGRRAVATRVVDHGEKIHLYGQDPRPGSHWWEAVVNKNKLPCS